MKKKPYLGFTDVLTPWLKVATQSPVASPRRHPMSSSAHSGGAPSARASDGGGGGRSKGSDSPSGCFRPSRWPDNLRSNCFNRPAIPFLFGPWASKSESEADEFDRRRRARSPGSTGSDIFPPFSLKALEIERGSKKAAKAQISLERERERGQVFNGVYITRKGAAIPKQRLHKSSVRLGSNEHTAPAKSG